MKPPPPDADPPPPSPDEVARLVQRVVDAEQELEACLAGGVDTVMDASGRPRLLGEAQRRLIAEEAAQREAAALQHAIIDALPGNLTLIDGQGNLIVANDAWQHFAVANGGPADAFVGANYLDICDRATGPQAGFAHAAAAGIRAVLRGERHVFNLEYPCHQPERPQWFRLVVAPLRTPHRQGAIIVHLDVTDRKLIELAAVTAEQQLAEVVQTIQVVNADATAMDEIMARVARCARQVTDADAVAIDLLEADTLHCTVAAGSFEPERDSTCPADSPSHEAIRTSALVIRADCRVTPDDHPLTIMAAPLRCGDAVLGAIRVGCRGQAPFTPRDIGNIQLLADSLGNALQRERTNARLAASEIEYRLLFSHNPHPMWVCDPTSQRILTVNDAAINRLGYSAAAFTRLTVPELLPPDSKAPFAATLAPRSTPTLERLRRGDGSIIDVETLSHPVTFDGQPALLVLAEDVTARRQSEAELARVNRALRLLSACNIALVRSPTEQALLDEICRLTHEVGSYPLAWIGFALDDDRRSIQPVARAGDSHLDIAALNLSWSAEVPEGNGPGGHTIRRGEPTVVQNLAESPLMRPWRDVIPREYYQGVVCLPLKSATRTFGIFTLYLDTADPLPPEEISLLVELAEDLAFGIQAHRTRLEQFRSQSALLKIARSVSGITSEDFFSTFIENLTEVTNASVCFVARVSPPGSRTLEPVAAFRDGRPLKVEIVPPACTPDLDSPELLQWWRDTSSSPTASAHKPIHAGMVLRDSHRQAIGILVVGFDREPENTAFVTSTLQIFAARASAELQRRVIDSHTRQQAQLIDEAHDAFIVRDLHDTIQDWSRGAESLYGWTAAEARGRKFHELLQPDPATFERAREDVLAHGRWDGEINQLNHAGQNITAAARWTLLRDDHGAPRAILSIDSDITAQKAVQSQLLRAQRMESIGTLAGGIAHDMNNLLAPIVMGVELLKPAVTTDSARRIIANMEGSAQRGAALVKQILSFARGVDGARVSVHPKHIVREVESLIENTFPKNITLTTRFDSDIPLVSADPTQLNQVLVNLCVNARDAMREGGTLKIRVRHLVTTPPPGLPGHAKGPAPYVCISVSDTGCGIPPGLLDRIFEPFFTTKPAGEGTGLGLATTLGIVRSHDGFILVDSQPGQGTTFRVHLPALRDAAPPASGQARPPVRPGRHELILVVDDEPSILTVAREILEHASYRVISATNGADALALFKSRDGQIAAVVTDLMMPDMDGLTLIAKLREETTGLPIIATSGLTDQNDLNRVIALGISHFLPKPFDAMDLLQHLQSALPPPSA